MNEINKDQLIQAEENLNIATVGDDIYHDLTLPSNVIGRIMYRKLNNQNVIEIYADGSYRGIKGTATIGILPEGFRPTAVSSIFGYAENNTAWSINDLFIYPDGTMLIPAGANDQMRGYAFFGVIRL